MNHNANSIGRPTFSALQPSPVKSGERASTTPIAPQSPSEQPARPESAHPFAQILRQLHGPAAGAANGAGPEAPASSAPSTAAMKDGDATRAGERAEGAAAEAGAAASEAAAAKLRARLAPPPGKPSTHPPASGAATPETAAATNPKAGNDDDRPGPRGTDGSNAMAAAAGPQAAIAAAVPGALPGAASAGTEAADAAAGAITDAITGAAVADAGARSGAARSQAAGQAATQAAASTATGAAPSDADNAKSERHRISAGDGSREPGATARSTPAAAEAASNPAGANDAPAPATAAHVPGAESLGALANLAASAPAAAPAATVAAAASAPVQTTVTVPLDAPGFAAAFGVQVSVLARDGVQHAELHLNPAETGPVSIRIQVEGSQARIDFGADLAATRQAIETSLPQLASALSEAGFTLAGGGVSQHAGSQGGSRSGGDGAPRRHSVGGVAASIAATAGGSGEAALRARARAAAGGVDLYA